MPFATTAPANFLDRHQTRRDGDHKQGLAHSRGRSQPGSCPTKSTAASPSFFYSPFSRPASMSRDSNPSTTRVPSPIHCPPSPSFTRLCGNKKVTKEIYVHGGRNLLQTATATTTLPARAVRRDGGNILCRGRLISIPGGYFVLKTSSAYRCGQSSCRRAQGRGGPTEHPGRASWCPGHRWRGA